MTNQYDHIGDGKELLGPNSPYIKLISSDGHEFIVKREHALLSNTFKAMLDGPGKFSESDTNQIELKEISSLILRCVCRYLAYKYQYQDCTENVPEFPIDPAIALEVLMASNFLDC